MTRRASMLVLSATLLAACGGGAESAPAPDTGTGPEAPAATATCGLPNFIEETLARVNTQRARGADCGTRGSFGAARPLTWSNLLGTAASAHSTDMAARDYFSHTSPDGGTLSQRVSAAGYAWSALAENIAAGPSSIEAVIAGWMDSDGHCANVMDPSLTEIGMACVASGSATYRIYWTMGLGRPR